MSLILRRTRASGCTTIARMPASSPFYRPSCASAWRRWLVQVVLALLGQWTLAASPAAELLPLRIDDEGHLVKLWKEMAVNEHIVP